MEQEKMVTDDVINGGLLTVKEEPILFLDEEEDDIIGTVNTNNGVDEFSSSLLPMPLEGLRDMVPPPFLKKTFEMVDDPNTDSIISWSNTKISFVVWDPHKFSIDLLPKHFKHNNFSSFIRQLNTYRFRKIDSDRWEFANEGFQKGKKHLLVNMKRRKQQHTHQSLHQGGGSAQSWLGSCNKDGFEAELEKLTKDQNTLKMEVQSLKQQQESTESYLATVKERLQNSETRQKYMVIFMAKAFKNPLFVQHLIEKIKQRKILDNGTVAKKRRLANTQCDNKCDGHSLQVQEEFTTIKSEIQTLFSSDESNSSADEQKRNSQDMSSENYILWEKLMEDDMIYENGAENDKHHCDIFLELEDLIAS
ncbi:PREDICTED: heat stress transcription factor A-2-like [Nicotiana attenuata]|uniref:Heat stress transcription factor n=1 Tax=Nicotiana attenuata TaxID=49451 RepID=A0A1J6K4T8_NICAT|nr:PREDICTED: heat stress transcription factor A-2-like [Nicotiana attenuata]OIT20096.1 heat stress transcription factor a-2 [Nicotiana attenuata]